MQRKTDPKVKGFILTDQKQKTETKTEQLVRLRVYDSNQDKSRGCHPPKVTHGHILSVTATENLAVGVVLYLICSCTTFILLFHSLITFSHWTVSALRAGTMPAGLPTVAD